jgi:hypothetical protein
MTGTDRTGKAGSGGELHMQTQAWTTPMVQDNRHATASPSEMKRHTPNLSSQAITFPTPTAKDADASRDTSMNPGSKRHKGKTLTDATANLWPTPRTLTGGGESAERKKELGREEAGGGDLQAAVESWPTPAARDHKGANSKKHVTETGTGRKHMDQLANFVEHSPSSPQAPGTLEPGEESWPTDHSTGSPRRLNPAFVCWLMGWPWWWTNPGVISSARQETESYLFRLRTLLSSLLREQGSSR